MDDFDVTPAMRAYLAACDAWMKDQSPRLLRARLAALRRLRDKREGRPLSWREREVLMLRTEGFRQAEIASRLGIGQETVKTHFRNVYAKAGTSDPFRLTLWAVRRGLVDL